MPRGITGRFRASVYTGLAGVTRGKLVDKEMTSFVRHGVMPKSDYAIRFLDHVQNVMKLTKLATQVYVESSNGKWGTPLDMVGYDSLNLPRIIGTFPTFLQKK